MIHTFKTEIVQPSNLVLFVSSIAFAASSTFSIVTKAYPLQSFVTGSRIHLKLLFKISP